MQVNLNVSITFGNDVTITWLGNRDVEGHSEAIAIGYLQAVRLIEHAEDVDDQPITDLLIEIR